LRIFSRLPKADFQLQWHEANSPGAKGPWLKIPMRLSALMETRGEPGALTVAGQWRSFTAFPNILAIAMMTKPQHCAAAVMTWKRFPCHELL